MTSRPLQGRLVREDEPGAEEIRRLVGVVGDRLQARFNEINDTMNLAIEDAIDVLDDPEILDSMHASVEGNVVTILHLLRQGIPLEHAQPITAATDYARRTAQQGVPSAALRRAYHIGSDDLLNHMFEEIQQLDAEADVKLRLLHHLAGWMHQYVDWITAVVLEVHEEERRHVLQRRASVVSGLVQRVLDGRSVAPADFLNRTGYRLSQVHIAAVAWLAGANQGTDRTADLTEVGHRLAGLLDSHGAPLLVPVDRNAVRIWIGVGQRSEPVDMADLRRRLDVDADVRVALGTPLDGPDGFRRSLEQAEVVKVVPAVASTSVTRAVGWAEDGMTTVARLAHDLGGTRRWVREVLGPLAEDTEGAERLRETVRVHLRNGGSYVRTGEVLLLHRNTVKYRIQQVEAMRGRPLEDGRLDLELALHAWHLLGSVVLVGGGHTR